MTTTIHNADILSWAATYDGEPFHAALLDAPYEMEFMGKGWDDTGVSFNPETWKAIARCLHPGAFLFVFAGTINDDLISVAMRQAGLRKYHRAMAWGYGSGFPKAARLDTVIDRRAGVERTKIGQRKHQPKFAAKDFNYRKKDNGYNSKDRATFDLTAPATELAQAWQGHRYGGQVLKPAVESILVFQKPYEGSPVSSITRTGAGAINVDGGRIAGPKGDGVWGSRNIDTAPGYGGGYDADYRTEQHPAGRWPANLMLDEHTAALLDRQSGESVSTKLNTIQKAGDRVYAAGIGSKDRVRVNEGFDDAGGASRFFFNADYVAERLEDADLVIYEAKSSRAEREAGLDPRQVRLINSEVFAEATINDGREKSIDNPYQRGETTRRNIHPTIKPISLARHLATLLLPPDSYAPRRLLVPFSGAGSETIGALLAGWDEIVGVELESDHCRIAQARLAYWQQRKHEFLDPSKPITAALADAPDGQLELF